MPKRPRIVSEEVTQCSICQENVEKGEASVTLACDHEFHFDCAQKWLSTKNTCPDCRGDAECVSQGFQNKNKAEKTRVLELLLETLNRQQLRRVPVAEAAATLSAPTETTILYVPYEARRYARLNGAEFCNDLCSWVWRRPLPIPECLRQYLNPPSRVFLRVPITEKDEAKILGARWDPIRRLWFFNGPPPARALERWSVIS